MYLNVYLSKIQFYENKRIFVLETFCTKQEDCVHFLFKIPLYVKKNKTIKFYIA